MKDSIWFVVELPPVSKKNSQQILINSKTKRPFVAPSQKYRQYERDAKVFMPKLDKPIDEPVSVKCLFYMPTRRRCDLPNMENAIDDIMVKYGVLADDNFKILVSHDGSRILYDKERPRTEITIDFLSEML